jgi:serine/threonine protein kinase
MPQQANQPLPAGYVLNGYRIEKPLSSGGFSIVYLARDEKDTPFAIKEYLPSSLPLRAEGVEITSTRRTSRSSATASSASSRRAARSR